MLKSKLSKILAATVLVICGCAMLGEPDKNITVSGNLLTETYKSALLDMNKAQLKLADVLKVNVKRADLENQITALESGNITTIDPNQMEITTDVNKALKEVDMEKIVLDAKAKAIVAEGLEEYSKAKNKFALMAIEVAALIGEVNLIPNKQVKMATLANEVVATIVKVGPTFPDFVSSIGTTNNALIKAGEKAGIDVSKAKKEAAKKVSK